MEIGELVSSVATSVQKAQQVMEYKTIENFLEYFIDSNTDKTADLTSEKFCPKFRTIEIPDRPQTRSISVPMMSLANHTGLSLDAVRIKLALNSYVENNRLQVTCKGRSDRDNSGEIELAFKLSDPSEGIARIVQKANSYI